MVGNTASQSAYLTAGRGVQDERSGSDESAAVEALRLTRRSSLLVTLALSLGLWAAIWAVIALLTPATLG
jgi:hypothetical protein